MVRNLFFLLIILFVSACEFLDGNTTDDKIALARVDNNYLYIEDIIFPSLPLEAPEITFTISFFFIFIFTLSIFVIYYSTSGSNEITFI